ncbi:MAG: DoxX family membrane protein [Elusimicrobia bacterium]|nr:DoxX family membrane protein [Elusimicrobiota bacterium]
MTKKPRGPHHPPERPGLAWAGLAMRILVGGVLALSGAGKAGAPPEEFAAAIEAYALVPPALILPIAVLVPWAEVVAGFALLAGWLTRWTAAAAAGLFGVFITALSSTMVRGIELADCGCFGFGFRLAPSQTVFLDIFLAGAACWLFLHAETALSLDAWAKEGS